MARKRKCRDVLCLLLFLAFWGGMFVVCAIAIDQGDPDRLIFGIDSYGMACGGKHTFGDTTMDLSNNKNLYYLNALDLLAITNIRYAKRMCVDGCPGEENVCGIGDFPCTSNAKFVCPYYWLAEDYIYDKLQNVSSIEETSYWEQLSTMNETIADSTASALIQGMEALDSLPWVGDFLDTYGINSSGPWTGRYYQLRSNIPGQGPCFPVLVQTKAYLNRCFPKFSDNFTQTVVEAVEGVTDLVSDDVRNKFNEEFDSWSNRISRYITDVTKAIFVIVVGGLISGVCLSIFWLILLRYMAGFMAWFTIIILNLLFVSFSLYCWSLSGKLGDNAVANEISDVLPDSMDPTQVDKTVWFWVAIVFSVITVLLLLFTLLMIKRIRIAIACIKVASQAIGSMPSILLFPFLPFLFEMGLVLYWVAIAGLMYTGGDLTSHCRGADTFDWFSFSEFSNFTAATSNITGTGEPQELCYTNETKDVMATLCGDDPNCYLSYDWNNNLKYAFLYHFFGLLWTNQVIVGFSCVTVAGSIASYYWAGGVEGEMPMFPVLTALKNTVVYHMGSIAFGALIMAIIQFIRFMLEYLENKAKAMSGGNKCVSWICYCCKYCMYCLELIVKFINRNAYIMVAIKGTNYCVSAGQALKLIVSNALRLLAVNVIGDILIGLAKLTVAIACGFIAFGLTTIDYYTDAEEYPDTYLSSPVLVVLVCVLTGWTIAEIFFSVYEMAIDTIILAFCEDCDANGGDPKFAPPLLMEVMGAKPDHQGNKVATGKT